MQALLAESNPGETEALDPKPRALQIRQNPETTNHNLQQPEPRSMVARRYDIDKNEIGSGGYGKAGSRASG